MHINNSRRSGLGRGRAHLPARVREVTSSGKDFFSVTNNYMCTLNNMLEHLNHRLHGLLLQTIVEIFAPALKAN